MTERRGNRASNEERIQREVQEFLNEHVSSSVLQQIIIGQDDDVQAIRLLGEVSERVGKKIADQNVATSQIRSIFGEVRSIQMAVTGLDKKPITSHAMNETDTSEQAPQPLDNVRVVRPLLMLRPKLAYQYGRTSDREFHKKVGMGILTDVLSNSIQIILKAPNTRTFSNFVDFFEAVLAYHRYYGGRTN
jgi:CRISPR-associated protein Csm2